MHLNNISLNSQAALRDFICSARPALYCASRTSTVLPFNQLEKMSLLLGSPLEGLTLAQLNLPPKIEILPNGHFVVSGALTWEQARLELHSAGRDLMSWPTETSACVLAGLATSATGERSFAFGGLRDQIQRIAFINHQAQVVELRHSQGLESYIQKGQLESYQKSYLAYQHFKNAPFPRLQYATDLMIGSEGQLGVIVEAEFKSLKRQRTQNLLLVFPHWSEEFAQHVDFVRWIQSWRGQVLACELIDAQSQNLLFQADRPAQGRDLVLIEVLGEAFEAFYQALAERYGEAFLQSAWELSGLQFENLRTSVPRAINEYLARHQRLKMGTDIQVDVKDLDRLFEIYKRCSERGVQTCLFGHLGDSHLHFNFLPEDSQRAEVGKELELLYNELASWTASPFAEHGIGLLKQKWIRPFYQDIHYKVFGHLKKTLDPKKQFFPHGFMGLEP